MEKSVDPENTLDLVVGRPRLLVLKTPPKRVQIESDEKNPVLTSTIVSDRELSLTGKRVGTAVLNLWFPDPKNAGRVQILSFLVRVLPDFRAHEQAREWQELYFKVLQREINRAFPRSLVCLSLVGDTLVVSGDAHDAPEATHIMRVVAANAPRGPKDEVAPIGPGQLSLTTATTELNLTGSATTQSTLTTPAQMPRAEPGLADVKTALGQADAAVAGGLTPRVINLLRIPGEQQVMLKVTVAEVNRSAARSIGINFSIRNNQGVQVFANTTGNILNASTGGTGTGSGVPSGVGSAANLPVVLDNGQLVLAINALRSLNLARTLAEPNLVALNGQVAKFQAGGEFPVPVVTGFTAAGLQGVSFVPFGVQLSFVPVITDKDRVRLTIAANVSTRDQSGGANVGGTSVPGLNTRNFQTTVELREGQTMAVAGLIQTNFGADATRVPLLGDLPIFGRFWAFDRTSAGEQELVIIVTPVLVHPLDCKAAPPLPGSDVFEPGDVEFYLLGRLESRRPYDYRSPARTDIDRMRRYHRCEQLLIAAPQGHSDGNPAAPVNLP